MSEDSPAADPRPAMYNVHPQEGLVTARGRLDGATVDGQEQWVLGKLYDLTIQIGAFGGVAAFPAQTAPSVEQQRHAEGLTLMHFMKENAGVSEAQAALENLDFRQPSKALRDDIRTVVQGAVEAYREALQVAQQAHRQSSERFVIYGADGWELSFEEQVSRWIQRLADIEEANQHLGLLNHLAGLGVKAKGEAQDALGEVERASIKLAEERKQLTDLRAQEASRALSDHFASLAKSERGKGTGLRLLSGFAVLVALFVTWKSGVSTDSTGSWTALSGHLAITLLLAGGAAYAAKLASSHYTFGQWAKSIQVQLDSFEGFIGVVEEQSARDRMREEFGRRVLGAPPQATEDGSPGLTTGELLQLLAAIRTPATK